MRQSGWRVDVRRGLRGVLFALAALLIAAAPVLAQGAVQDAGNMFSGQARQNVADTIAQIEKDTGKQVVVRTVPNLGGKDISAVADQTFRDLNVNGVLLFAAKDDKKLAIKVGTNTRQQLSVSEETAIRDQLTAAFAKGDFDGGLTSAVNRIGSDLRANAAGRTSTGAAGQPAPSAQPKASFPWGIFLLLLIGGIILAAFLARRAARNAQGPLGGYGHGDGPQPYGGYGPNYGHGGSGSGFGGGLAGGVLGGIGGAIAGNAIYDRLRGNSGNAEQGGTAQTGDWGGGGNDFGQPADSPADVGSWGDSGASVGDWGGGDSGGGGDSSA